MINPFAIWTRMIDASIELGRTGQRMAETLSAAQTVIDVRSGLIRTAIRSPLDGEYRELSRMVPEKIDAFSRGGSAAATIWWSMQADMMAQAQQLGRMAMAGRWPTIGEWSRLAAANVAHGTHAIEQSVAIGAQALQPVHAQATANARRLRPARRG